MKEIEYIGRIVTENKEYMDDMMSKLSDTNYVYRRYQYDGELEIICEVYKELETGSDC